MIESSPAADLPFAEFAKRLKKLQAYQKREKLDALFVLTEVNLYYFTGLTCDNGVLLAVRGKEPEFYTDFRYIVMAKRKAPGLKSELIWSARDEKQVLADKGKTWRRIGYEGKISASRFLSLKAAFPDAEWIDVSGGIMEMRSIKSSAEQRVMRRAIARNDDLFGMLLGQLEFGQTEWSMRAFVRRACDILGQGEAFDTIACVGANAAECHHEPDETVLTKGKPLLVDLGVRVDHYCSDMTRCVCFGRPTKLYTELHRIVHEANRAAIKAIKPGVPCCEIDAVARDYIAKAGYGKAFGHSLGHSVGLEIHEMPGFASTCKTPLKPGMLITVEPGIYLPNRAGVRLEDMILVTRTGCEILSQTPHDLFL